MLWPHPYRVRAWAATGLLGCTLLGVASLAGAASDDTPPKPDPVVTETVPVLQARRSGALAVEVRGAGPARVRMTFKNTSTKRLSIIIPPGLVASSVTGQAAGGGGGGVQSMGLGSVSNRPGSFGEFQPADSGSPTGLRSVGVKDRSAVESTVVVPVGQTIELSVVSVCLNYGVATPTFRDRFKLVDVDDYSTDPHVRKALRSLATYGTSHGVAQAVMWRVCNGLTFEEMLLQSGETMNPHEIALAARFVEEVDASASAGLVDPASLEAGRLYVRVTGEGALARDARRLAGEVEGLKILGLRVRAYDEGDRRTVAYPAVLLNVILLGSQAGQTRGRILLDQTDNSGRWVPLGKTPLVEGSAVSVLDGATLARALDRAVASAYVTVKPAHRGTGTTTFKVDNRLPFTLARISVKAGSSAGAPTIELKGLGIAPARAGLVTIEAPIATVEHVELNGL